jgi:hypothetical protein
MRGVQGLTDRSRRPYRYAQQQMYYLIYQKGPIREART